MLSVLLALVETAPVSAAFLGANPRLAENRLNTGTEHVAGDISRKRLPAYLKKRDRIIRFSFPPCGAMIDLSDGLDYGMRLAEHAARGC